MKRTAFAAAAWLLALALCVSCTNAGTVSVPSEEAPPTAAPPVNTSAPTEKATEVPSEVPSENETEPQEAFDWEARLRDPVLQTRRETVLAWMRKNGMVLWTPAEDIVYYVHSGKDKVTLNAGTVYRGIPYTGGEGTVETLLKYAVKSENGVYTVSGLTGGHLTSANANGRPIVGTDCSGAAVHALSQVSNSFVYGPTKGMTEQHGYIPVGDYVTTSGAEHSDTWQLCMKNGVQTMAEAYSHLAPADGLVHYQNGAGHAMIVSEVHVERDADGRILVGKSYVKTVHQTSGYVRKSTQEFDERVNGYVRVIWGIDSKFSFSELFNTGYFPYTVLELIDPSVPTPEAFTVRDSVETPSYADLFGGRLLSEIGVVSAEMEIRNESGETEQKGVYLSPRSHGDQMAFQVAWFLRDDRVKMPSWIEADQIASGKHRCILTVMLSDGSTYRVRDFWFEKP